MEQKSVVERLMEQLRVMGDLQKLFDSSKMLKKHEKLAMMQVEEKKLAALKQEQLAQSAPPRVLPAAGQPPDWDQAIAAANAESKARKKRQDYIDWPCSKVGSNPLIQQHGTYTTWKLGREIIRKAITENTLYEDVQRTKEFMSERMGGRIGGAGVPGEGKMDWEFQDGRGFR